MEETRIECDLKKGPGHSLQCSHCLFLQMQTDSSMYTNLQGHAMKYSEKLRNHTRFLSSKAILENLFFKRSYLRMRRVSHGELKSTKLALQLNE